MINLEDLTRLSIELRAQETTLANWATRIGISEDTLQELAEMFMNDLDEITDARVKNELQKKIEDGEIPYGEVGMLAVDTTPILKAAMFSAFVLGWETRKQYGEQS